MVKIETLNEFSSLRDSGFGQPNPRHGLNLLYWFSRDAVAVRNGVLVPTINITGKDYGFERFYNNIDDDDDRLLPDQNQKNQNQIYYEVGNLNKPGAENLPAYVRAGNRPNYYGDFNMDRIIVGLKNGIIVRVYITQHSDSKNFSHSATYRVSQGLIQNISAMERNQFLQKVKKDYYQNQSRRVQEEEEPDNSWFSWCTIL